MSLWEVPTWNLLLLYKNLWRRGKVASSSFLLPVFLSSNSWSYSYSLLPRGWEQRWPKMAHSRSCQHPCALAAWDLGFLKLLCLIPLQKWRELTDNSETNGPTFDVSKACQTREELYIRCLPRCLKRRVGLDEASKGQSRSLSWTPQHDSWFTLFLWGKREGMEEGRGRRKSRLWFLRVRPRAEGIKWLDEP